MNRELAARGQDARNELQLQLLETREMDDALAGLAFLRALPEVDARDITAIAESFGGSLTVLLAERDPTLRAVVIFSCAGYSWDKSPPLRARLLAAVGRTAAPIFFIHAANDYSLAGKALDAELARLERRTALRSTRQWVKLPRTDTTSPIVAWPVGNPTCSPSWTNTAGSELTVRESPAWMFHPQKP